VTDAPPSRCEACGYDLSGLPANAVCPECGIDEVGRPPDAIEREPAEVVGRIATGLWFLCLAPCVLAIGIVWFFTAMIAAMLASVFGWGDLVREVVVGVLGTLMVVGALSWAVGWWFAAVTPTLGEQGRRRIWTQRVSGVAAVLVMLNTLLIVGSVFGLRIPGLVAHAAVLAVMYGTLALLGLLAVVGPLVLEDLARRCDATEFMRIARRFRFLLFVVPLAFMIGLPLQAMLAPYRGGPTPSLPWSPPVNLVLVAVDFVLGLIMAFGPLGLVGVVAAGAFALMPRVEAVYEDITGTAHWTARGRAGAMLRFAGWCGGGQRRGARGRRAVRAVQVFDPDDTPRRAAEEE
jgi:hypothetical protein